VKTFDVYGTSSMTPAQLRDRLTSLLKTGFQERESSYWGIYFLGGDPRREHFRILDNVHDDPEELPYLEFADVPVVLEVNEPDRPDELRELLESVPGLVLLRRKEIT
jgi:hypothetical protein